MWYCVATSRATLDTWQHIGGPWVVRLRVVQVGRGGVESMQQDVREAGLPDADGAVHTVAAQRYRQARACQALWRGPARAAASLQQHGVPCPVEDGGVVPGEKSSQSDCASKYDDVRHPVKHEEHE